MLRESIEQLEQANMSKATLTVTGDNKQALALYERLGFREVDMDILMSKSLTKLKESRN